MKTRNNFVSLFAAVTVFFLFRSPTDEISVQKVGPKFWFKTVLIYRRRRVVVAASTSRRRRFVVQQVTQVNIVYKTALIAVRMSDCNL